jgi:iron(III) transport system substrate-binding protein
MGTQSSPKRRLGISSAIVAAVLFVASSARAADPETVSKIVNYAGADRQAFLEAGAKKEGKLLVYAVGTQIRPLMEAFKKKHPYISYQLYRGDSASIAQKVLEEYKAGRYNVDAFELNIGALQPIRNAGFLASYQSPEMKSFDPEAVEPKKHWVVARESYLSLGYNTDKIKPQEIPQTYDDLLDPKWKGRMAISGRTSTIGDWVGAMVLTKGEDYVRELGQQNIRVYQTSGRALANLVVSGEVALSPAIYNSHVFSSREKGAHIAWHALGPTYVTVTAAAIPARSNAPHAAALLMDFLLSREGQAIYAKLGYSSARTDMPDKEGPPKKLYLASRPNYEREFEQWMKLANEVFIRPAKK